MTHERELASQVRRYQIQLAGGIGGAVFFAATGAIVFLELRELESGVRESVAVWRPAAFLYRLFGLWGAVSLFAAMTLLAVGVSFQALQARSRLIHEFSKDTILDVRRSLDAGTPRFLRGTEDTGRLPRSTIIMGILLLLLLAAAVAGVKLGVFH